MTKNFTVFLQHILESILLIEEYTANLSKSQFFKDRVSQDAIIRRLEIIGEAVKNLPPHFRAKHTEIPWKQIAGMRDILIHQYFEVDLALAWQVVVDELPPLKKNLTRLIEEQKE